MIRGRRPLCRAMCLTGALAGPLLAAGCGPEGKSVPTDEVAPESAAYVALSGAETPLTPAGVLLAAKRATVRIQMNEPGQIFYTQDGSEPDPAMPTTGQGGDVVFMTLVQDTELRWVAVDRAGNREATSHSTFVHFDQQAPEATIDPEPAGFRFPGPITVTVRANEPVTIYYRIDGGLAVAGGADTLVASDTLDLALAHPTSLSIRVVDVAGNLWGPKFLKYDIDDVAPVSTADPAGGRFLKPLEVRLGVDDPSATQYFTLDGSEPDESSPVWSDALTLSEPTTLKFRAVDPGGNWEATRTEQYEVGPLGARSPTPAVDAERIDVAGNLELAAALMRAAGPWSGLEGTPTRRDLDYDLWATGRQVIDGILFQSHGGYSPVYSPLNLARAGSAQASPDRDGNGSNLEETLAASLNALAAPLADTVPTAIYPLVLPFEGVSSLLLRDPGHETRADGLPVSEDDYGLVTWQGTAGAQRNHTAAAFHATLAAYAARIAGATLASHTTDETAFGTDVAPVIGQRCVGCHRPGQASPDLTEPTGVQGLVSPGAPATSRLLQILALDPEHPSQPATAAQRAAVGRWIEAGGVGPSLADVAPGPTAREGLLAAIAWQSATWGLDWAGRQLGMDPATGRLNVLGTNGVRYLPASIRATEQAGPAGMPRRPQAFAALDPRYELGVQARGVVAALALVEARSKAAAFGATVGLDDAGANLTPGDYARNGVALLVDRCFDAEADEYRASFSPEAGLSAEVDAAGLGDALTALAAAWQAGALDAEKATARIDAILRQLETSLRRPDGWFAAQATPAAGTRSTERPEVRVQLALMQGLLAAGQAGHAAADEAARALWGRLDAFWDADVGAWQSALGEPVYTYDAALAARAVATLDAASRAGLADAENRFRAFVAAVVYGGLLSSETWWTGEVADGADDDHDGLLKPSEVPVGQGVAPAFRREIRFE